MPKVISGGNTPSSTKFIPRSFADSNNNGVGDLNGIASKLDYLKDLGVDAIWMTPFFPSPQVDFGYDVSDYDAIDPMYGTLADFDHLSAEAKQRNIRLILDLVVNHTSDQHPWFKESRSSRDNPSAIGISGVMAKALVSLPTTGFPPSASQRGLSIPGPSSITTIIFILSSPT